MKAYETVWLGLCGMLAIIGVGAAVLWSIGATLAFFVCGAVVGGGTTRYLPPLRGEVTVSRPDLVRLAGRNACLGGTSIAAIAGLGVLLGIWTLPVLALAAGCCPYAIQAYRRRLARRPAWEDVSAPGDPVGQRPPGTASVLTMEPTVDTSTMTEAELCRAWRASFPALQAAASEPERLRIVENRAAYLDELERRNPRGLSAWLASGARAAGNPTDFMIGRSGARRSPIDWDNLISGQDR